MKTHILIPEAHSYGVAILIIYSLSGFVLASLIHRHWLAAWRIGFGPVYAGVMGCTMGYGLLLVDPMNILGRSGKIWMLSLPVGLLAGWLSAWADRQIARRYWRRELVAKLKPQPQPNMKTKTTTNSALGSGVRLPASRNLSGRFDSVPAQAAGGRRGVGQELFTMGIGSLLSIATLEELVFRGLLLQLCLALPGTLPRWSALFLLVALFALSHLHFGWPQVVAKLPLSLLTTGCVLCMGSVLPAVIAHMVFNFRAWQSQLNQPRIMSAQSGAGPGMLTGSRFSREALA